MPHFLKQCAAALAAAAFFTGCASYTEETRSIRDSFRNDAYDAALEKLEASSLKGQERNRLLFLMERAMILDRLGRRDESRKLLMKADDVVDELRKSSLTGDAASFLYNDSASDYQGEDYEKVALHTVLALSFLEDGDRGAAQVEARRINTRLTEINNFYEDHKNRYGEDAFARYLAAVVHESKGDWDAAIVDYRAALAVYEDGYSKNFDTGTPDMMVTALHRLYKKRNRGDEARRLAERYPTLVKKSLDAREGDGEIVVIHEVGEITPKTTEDFVWPIGGQIVRFSFPVIHSRARALYGRNGIKVGRQDFQRGDLVQNMDAIASDTLEDRRTRLMLKQGARLLLKGQMVQQAEKNFGVLGYIGASIYSAFTETADTRGWTLLPGAYYLTRVRVPAGKHDVLVTTNDRLANVRTVQVKAGEVTFLRERG